MTLVPTRAAAQKFVKAAGFTEFHAYSESGDHGYKSREYWKKPGCEVNQYGCPMGMACISKVGRQWAINL